MTEELLLCQCGDPSHQLIIFYDDEQEVPTVYVTVHLSPNRNFFKRLWRGIKYIFFNKRSIYGDFDEIILRPNDVDKLRRAVELLESTEEEDAAIIPVIINKNSLPS
jgi:hypothetical protein